MFLVRIGEREHTVRLLSHEAGLLSFEVDGRVLRAAVETRSGGVEVILEGRRAVFLHEAGGPEVGLPGSGGARSGGADMYGLLRAELPGRVLEVRAKEGDLLEGGEVLLLTEAMKWDYPLRAPGAARVGRVHVRAGQQIAAGDPLIELLPPEETSGSEIT
jgi:3-methylcrotonyl-CoA carboxylase alpha subunit